MLGRATVLEARVIESIRSRMESARMSQREAERRLHWRRGSVSSLLRGRSRLRLIHIELLGEAVGFTVHDVLLEAFNDLVKKTCQEQGAQSPFDAH